jgi:hypothetical protein
MHLSEGGGGKPLGDCLHALKPFSNASTNEGYRDALLGFEEGTASFFNIIVICSLKCKNSRDMLALDFDLFDLSDHSCTFKSITVN